MYINECIRSLQNQTYENIEIIFHDDFSSDNSLDKINKFKNIKIIKNKKRNKVGSFNQIEAYKREFKKSTGDIIFLLDSDDFFAKNKIETIVKFFSNNKKLVSVFDLPILKYGQNLIFKKNKKK